MTSSVLVEVHLKLGRQAWHVSGERAWLQELGMEESPHVPAALLGAFSVA